MCVFACLRTGEIRLRKDRSVFLTAGVRTFHPKSKTFFGGRLLTFLCNFIAAFCRVKVSSEARFELQLNGMENTWESM